ncbi:MAG: hypothetical protein JST00_38140 [Deltaproteobacteria bacterium]|nr:hypothetical protein [Deltaproteobacteria bacterium]
MTHHFFVRGFLVAGLAAVTGLGCAVETRAEPAAEGSEAPPSDANDVDGELGTSQQALTNCATGDAPNETFDLSVAPSSGSITRSSQWLNPNGPCGANWRRVSIVDFPVNPYRTNDLHTFDVKTYGNFSDYECFGLVIYVRLQLWDSGRNEWVTVDYQHGNPDNPDSDYNAKLRGRIDLSTGRCVLPTARLGRTNYPLAGSSWGTMKYRLRAYITKRDGTNAGLTMKGHNEG